MGVTVSILERTYPEEHPKSEKIGLCEPKTFVIRPFKRDVPCQIIDLLSGFS